MGVKLGIYLGEFCALLRVWGVTGDTFLERFETGYNPKKNAGLTDWQPELILFAQVSRGDRASGWPSGGNRSPPERKYYEIEPGGAAARSRSYTILSRMADGLAAKLDSLAPAPDGSGDK